MLIIVAVKLRVIDPVVSLTGYNFIDATRSNFIDVTINILYLIGSMCQV